MGQRAGLLLTTGRSSLWKPRRADSAWQRLRRFVSKGLYSRVRRTIASKAGAASTRSSARAATAAQTNEPCCTAAARYPHACQGAVHEWKVL